MIMSPNDIHLIKIFLGLDKVPNHQNSDIDPIEYVLKGHITLSDLDNSFIIENKKQLARTFKRILDNDDAPSDSTGKKINYPEKGPDSYAHLLKLCSETIISPFYLQNEDPDIILERVKLCCDQTFTNKDGSKPYNHVRALFSMISLAWIVACHENWPARGYIGAALGYARSAREKAALPMLDSEDARHLFLRTYKMNKPATLGNSFDLDKEYQAALSHLVQLQKNVKEKGTPYVILSDGHLYSESPTSFYVDPSNSRQGFVNALMSFEVGQSLPSNKPAPLHDLRYIAAFFNTVDNPFRNHYFADVLLLKWHNVHANRNIPDFAYMYLEHAYRNDLLSDNRHSEYLSKEFYKIAGGMGLAKDDIDLSSFIKPLRNEVIRNTLGLDKAQNLWLANYLNEYTKEIRCDDWEIYDAIDFALENQFRNKSKEAFKVVREFYGDPAALEDAPNMIEAINSEYLVNALKLVNVIAAGENWETRDQWNNLEFIARAAYYGLNPAQITLQTLSVGPFYNDISPNGLPVLGENLAINYNPIDGNTHYIEPGMQRLIGVRGTEDNNVNFSFEFDQEKPALILEEDIDVAMVLAFSEKAFLWPSIDIQRYEDSNQTFLSIQKLELSPSWLNETDFGRTLYITDMLAGRLSWHPKEFNITEDPILSAIAISIINGVQKFDKAPNPALMKGMMVNTNPKDVFVPPEENNPLDFKFIGATLGIDSGYTLRTPQGDERWAYKNNTEYKYGKISNYLTENFNDVATVLPVYERLRQLMGMVYALRALKETGFVPSPELQSDIDAKKAVFEQNYKGPKYVRPLPLYSLHSVSGCHHS